MSTTLPPNPRNAPVSRRRFIVALPSTRGKCRGAFVALGAHGDHHAEADVVAELEVWIRGDCVVFVEPRVVVAVVEIAFGLQAIRRDTKIQIQPGGSGHAEPRGHYERPTAVPVRYLLVRGVECNVRPQRWRPLDLDVLTRLREL